MYSANVNHAIRVLCMPMFVRCAFSKWRSENSPIINIQLRNYLLSLSVFSSLFFSIFRLFALFRFFCIEHWCHQHSKLFISRDAVTLTLLTKNRDKASSRVLMEISPWHFHSAYIYLYLCVSLYVGLCAYTISNNLGSRKHIITWYTHTHTHHIQRTGIRRVNFQSVGVSYK